MIITANRTKFHKIDTNAQNIFKSGCPIEWVVEDMDEDYGLDYMVQVFDENDNSTPVMFFVQLKGQESVKIDNGIVKFPFKVERLKDYLMTPLPVFLILVNVNDNNIYWLFLQDYIINELNKNKPNWKNQKTVTLSFSSDNLFSNDFKKLETIAYNGFRDKKLILSSFKEIEHLINNFEYSQSLKRINEMESFWEYFDNEDKYKLLILKGKTYRLTLNLNESSKCFTDAFEYKKSDKEALYYKFLGLVFSNDFDNAEKCANKLLKYDNLKNKTYSVLSFIWNEKGIGIDKIIEKIPDKSLYSKKVSYQIANIAQVHKDENNAKKFYENTFKEGENSPDFFANYAIFKWGLIVHDEDKLFKIHNNQINTDEIKEIKIMLEKTLDKFPKHDLEIFKNRLTYIINLIDIKVVLHDYDNFKELIDLGLKISPDNNHLLLKKSELFKIEKKYDDAKSIIYSSIDKDYRHIYFLKEILFTENKENELVNKCNNLFKTYKNNKKALIAIREVLVETYIKIKDFDKALNELNLIKNKGSNLRYLNFEIQILKNKKDDKYKKLFIEANKLIDNSKLQDILIYANLLYLYGQLNEAISIYENNLNPKKWSEDIEFLLDSYSKTKNFGKIVEISKHFREKGIIKKFPLRLEIDAYLDIHDFENVKNLINLFLKEFGEDYHLKLQLARLNMFLKNFNEVDSFLNENYDLTDISLYESMLFYTLCKLRNHSKEKLLDLCYEIKIKHLNNIEADKFYFREILELNMDLKKDNPKKISFENGAVIKYNNDSPKLIFFTEKENINPDFEVNPSSKLVKLVGYKKGDIIKLEFNNKVEILDVLNKYHFTFRHILNHINNIPSIHSIKLNEDNDTKFKSIHDIVDMNESKIKELEKSYETGFLPLCFFSKNTNMDIIDIYHHVSSKKGIKSSSTKILGKPFANKKIVFDITALLTIHHLGIEEKITNLENEFLISFSTLLELRYILYNCKSLDDKVEMSIGSDNGKHFIIEANYKNKIDLVEKLIKWVEKNCKIIPIYKKFSLNEKESEVVSLFNKIDCNNIMDNILIASEEDALFFSDDVFMREIANDLFKVDSIWTQDFIEFCNEKLILNDEERLACTNKLYLNDFKTVDITFESILKPIFDNNDWLVLFKWLNDIIFNTPNVLQLSKMEILIKNCENDTIEFLVLKEIFLNTLICFQKENRFLINYIYTIISKLAK